MSGQPATADHVRRHLLEPETAHAVRADAAQTCERADQFVVVLEDTAANRLPAVVDYTLWEELREAHLARLAAQHPAVV